MRCAERYRSVATARPRVVSPSRSVPPAIASIARSARPAWRPRAPPASSRGHAARRRRTTPSRRRAASRRPPAARARRRGARPAGAPGRPSFAGRDREAVPGGDDVDVRLVAAAAHDEALVDAGRLQRPDAVARVAAREGAQLRDRAPRGGGVLGGHDDARAAVAAPLAGGEDAGRPIQLSRSRRMSSPSRWPAWRRASRGRRRSARRRTRPRRACWPARRRGRRSRARARRRRAAPRGRPSRRRRRASPSRRGPPTRRAARRARRRSRRRSSSAAPWRPRRGTARSTAVPCRRRRRARRAAPARCR